MYSYSVTVILSLTNKSSTFLLKVYLEFAEKRHSGIFTACHLVWYSQIPSVFEFLREPFP